MKTLITLHDIVNLDMLLQTTDGVLIGNNRFGTRLCHSFSLDDIQLISNEAKKLDKEVFIIANQMMTDDDLEAFSIWLDEIDQTLIDGYVVADLGAVVLLQEKGLNHKAVYNPETLATNTYDFNFLMNLGVLGVYAAKEITLQDLKLIGSLKTIKMFMVGHGHLNMFYSKRQLIKNYTDYLQEDLDLHNKHDLKIIEENRTEDPYPILEDDAGTHVFRSHVMSSLDKHSDLAIYVDYMIIDTIFKDDRYGALISTMYLQKNDQLKESIMREYDEIWDEGFLFKKTIYKGKGGEQ